MENSRSCEICNVNVRGASFVKHLRSKKHLENAKQNEMIIPERLFKEAQAPIKNKIKNIYNPKTLKQITRENIKMNDKELDKELAKKMINPDYFIDKILKICFEINLESHKINHANFLLKAVPSFPDIGIETIYNNKILKEMATTYVRLKNQYNFKNHIFFSASFYRINEEDQRSYEIE